MPTPSHRRARRRGMLMGAAISSRRAKSASNVPPAPQTQPMATPPTDKMAQLTELKNLLDNNLITQADFDTKKAQILGL